MKTIKTALLSFGMSGKVFHAPFLHVHNGYELAGSLERSKKHIQQIYPYAKSYSSLQEILDDKSIELVVVNTPTISHYEYAKAALLAGKNVVVEKAFTTSVKQAEELKQIAEESKVKISIYQNRRWDSDFLTMQNVYNSNLLGDIIEAEIRFERYKPEIGIKLHKEVNEPGAGLLNDLGPHVIDQALCLFGMPKKLYADIRITRKQSIVDDWFEITLYYDACIVKLKSTYFAKEPMPAYVLQGTKGSFIKYKADVQEAELIAGKLPYTVDWGIEPQEHAALLNIDKDGKTIREKVPSEKGNYGCFYEAVYNSITQNIPMPVTCDEAISVMKIIEAARLSNKERREVEV